ncbi:MAG: glycosyltransferase family 4 protein [Candidatus Kerfeldbacteria bacterium]|nr:glycosyltransferase family 4 protein [Candidatus Kerfeldbacteria bacterium]
MNILQINKFYSPAGGADQYMLELSQALKERGHTVVPFAMAHPENLPTSWSQFFPSFVETENMSGIKSGFKTLGRLFYSREAQQKLEALLAEFTPDVAHVHNIYHQLSPSLLTTLAKHHIPIVLTAHDHKLVSPLYTLEERDTALVGRPWKQAWDILLHRRFRASLTASVIVVLETALHRVLKLYRHVTTIVAPSICMRDLLLRAGYPVDRIRMISHGIASPRVEGVERKDHVLFVGRLKWEKGCDVLLEAARRVPQARIRIIGTGPDEDQLKAFAQTHGLTNVQFLRHVPHEHIFEHMSRARGVIVPSRFVEPFGLSALEAAACGTPVIASRIGALPEIVQDHVTGLLFEPKNPADLAAKMQWALDHPASFAKFGESARIHSEGFTFARHVDSILHLYADVAHA